MFICIFALGLAACGSDNEGTVSTDVIGSEDYGIREVGCDVGGWFESDEWKRKHGC